MAPMFEPFFQDLGDSAFKHRLGGSPAAGVYRFRPSGPEQRDSMTTRAVADRVQEIYGENLVADAGVVQVSSGWEDADSDLHGIRIGPSAPRSSTDEFVLGLARARADVVVTTGRILRQEPDLQYRLSEAADLNLAAWRHDQLRRRTPAEILILTSGQDLDWDHPIFGGVSSVSLFMGTDAAASEMVASRPPGVRVIPDSAPSLQSLLQFLRARTDVGTISLEVGPSTAGSLYRRPGWIQEWMLSVYLAVSLPKAVMSGLWPNAAARAAAGLSLKSEHIQEEESGTWAFQRFQALG